MLAGGNFGEITPLVYLEGKILANSVSFPNITF